MEVSREEFRWMIFYDYKSGRTANQCFEHLTAAFGDQMLSKTTVYGWYAEFHRGRTSLSDQPREGRPRTSVSPEFIEAVRNMIEADRHVSYNQIRACLDIGMRSVQAILQDELAMKKVCGRWISRHLTDAQKMARVEWCEKMLEKYGSYTSAAASSIIIGDRMWIYSRKPGRKRQSSVWMVDDEPDPTTDIYSRNVSKLMIACFFGPDGHVSTVTLEDRRSIDADWYTANYLPEIISALKSHNRNRRIILYLDEANCHTALQADDYLKEENIELMSYCPSSPDLSPCDFFSFPFIKIKMRVAQFSTPEEAVDAFKTHVSKISAFEWIKCFEEWFERMQECIKLGGEFIEME